MGDSLPSDPYIALGVEKDATAAAIKTKYRKLVLKFHPDKVQDESQKQAAADEFHKIQTAYEIVSDEARRARYDAQCKLSELRKDVTDRGLYRQSSDEERRSRYPTPPEPSRGDYFSSGDRGPRGAPQYSTEERRPSYAPPQDYFEPQPRSTSRKDPEYERVSRRAPVREERSKSAKSTTKAPKKEERSSRKEKSRKSDRETRQDRERKYAPSVMDDDSSDESDVYERRPKQPVDEEKLRRVREDYYEHERRQREQAEQGHFDDRTRKLFAQSSQATEHMARNSKRGTSERRPSPVRAQSARGDVEIEKGRNDRPQVVYRRGSGRPQTATRTGSRRTREHEIVEEPEQLPRDHKRPPTFGHSQSSPDNIRIPNEKIRSHSMQQPESTPTEDHQQPPRMRRAETMPYPTATRESRATKPSGLRASQLPTPEVSPERQQPRRSRQQSYTYPEETDYKVADSYNQRDFETQEIRPEVRPERTTSRKRYPEDAAPSKEPRDRHRSTSTKQSAPAPPPLSRNQSSRTTQYKVADPVDQYYARPGAPTRELSRLYGEIPTTRSPVQSRGRYSPPAEMPHPHVTRNYAEEAINMQSGFRTKKDRPTSSRRETSSRTARA